MVRDTIGYKFDLILAKMNRGLERQGDGVGGRVDVPCANLVSDGRKVTVESPPDGGLVRGIDSRCPRRERIWEDMGALRRGTRGTLAKAWVL